MPRLNMTGDYYRNHPVDLLTEYTICESLSYTHSPYMAALERPRSYGALVGEKLRECGLLHRGCRLCEIGGGRGSLMAGLLEEQGNLIDHVLMVDLSLSFLKQQRKRLEPWKERVGFLNTDIGGFLPPLTGQYRVILNEVAGDLDTWADIDSRDLPPPAAILIERYRLAIPRTGFFHFNIGAILLVEELCRRGIPAFITEHACDCLIPRGMEYLSRGLQPDGYPREIRLKGHSEFTIRFDHLIAVARWWGRDVQTGPLIDLVGIGPTPKMRFIFTAGACATDEQEHILELLDHIREYRWLIIR
ncbi:MAG: hypothetical protein JXI32_08615 [Deltaproteobacteria bacterium]|nr:hypothetical protein [Deltaproteobacteria bacterium]